MVALSFVREATDLDRVFEVMERKGKTLPVISKIEKPEALANIDAIIEKIVRGDDRQGRPGDRDGNRTPAHRTKTDRQKVQPALEARDHRHANARFDDPQPDRHPRRNQRRRQRPARRSRHPDAFRRDGDRGLSRRSAPEHGPHHRNHREGVHRRRFSGSISPTNSTWAAFRKASADPPSKWPST